MSKRNFDDTRIDSEVPQHGEEPPAKRLNLPPAVEESATSEHSEIDKDGKIPSPNEQTSSKPQSLLAGMLEKTTVESTKCFDKLQDYFDRILGESGVSSKLSSGGDQQSEGTNLDAAESLSQKASTVPVDCDLPQMILNPKARMKAEMMKNRPDVVPLSDRRSASPPKLTGQTVAPAPSSCSDSHMTLPLDINQVCCLVEHLVKRFQTPAVRTLSGSELWAYISQGRPQPCIPSLGVTQSLYDHHGWLTGCPTLERLFCWTCLLFVKNVCKTQNTVWLKEGFDSMNMLGSSMTNHLKSTVHTSALQNRDQTIAEGKFPEHLLTGNLLNELRAMQAGDPSGPSKSSFSIDPTRQSLGLHENCDVSCNHALMVGSSPNQPLGHVDRTALSQGSICSSFSYTQNPQSRAQSTYDLTQPGNSESNSTRAVSGRSPKRSEYKMLMNELQAKERVLGLPQATPATDGNRLCQDPSRANPAAQPVSCVDFTTLRPGNFPFFKGTEGDRERLIAGGRPTPDMPGMAKIKCCITGVYFNKSYYDEFSWLCGSEEMNRLYCWPCLVFSDHTRNNVWNTIGIGSMEDLTSKAKFHSYERSHMELALRLKLVEVRLQTGSHPIEPKGTRVEEDGRKRLLLRYLIDAVCFKKKLLSNVEISHSHYNDFLAILSRYDKKLKVLLDPTSKHYVADFVPTVAANYASEVVGALTTMLRRKIVAEVENAAFVSFILKRVKNNLVAFIVRYAESTGVVRERFYKLIHIGFGHPEQLLKLVFSEVAGLKCSTKFVGISYDGGVLRPDQAGYFNSQVRSSLPSAFFFHHRDDDINDLLHQSLMFMQQCRSFFQVVREFEKFCNENPQVQKFISKTAASDQAKYDLDSSIIVTIRDHYSEIMKFLTQVVGGPSAPGPRSNRVVSQCKKFLTFFGIRETRLCLVLFSVVHQCLGSISMIPTVGSAEFQAWKYSASLAYGSIYKLKTQFIEILAAADNMINGTAHPCSTEDINRLVTMFNSALDWVLAFTASRTKNFSLGPFFDFSTKIACNPFAHAETDQANTIAVMKGCFPLLDPQELCKDLILISKDPIFQDKSTVELTQLMNQYDFKSLLPTLYSYLLLIQAVPLSSACVSNPISSRLTAYVEGKTRLTPEDAILHLEKDLLASLQNEKHFYEDVLEIIAQRKGTNDL